MILRDPKQSCERGDIGVFIPSLQMRKLWPREVIRLVPANYLLSEPESECSLLIPQTVLFSYYFPKMVLSRATA